MANSRIQRRFKSYHGKKISTKRENPIPVHFSLKDFKIDTYSENYQIVVNQVKKRGFSHPGSIPGYKLKNIVNRDLYPHTHIAMNYFRPRF